MKNQTTPGSTGHPIEVNNPLRKRLLLICDVPERLQQLESTLGFIGVEMTKAGSAEEMTHACRRDHDLAVVDVEPVRLAEVLQTLRESAAHVGIPLLVESSRLSNDPTLAGVLPEHRAMPCSFEEVKKLARRRLTPSATRSVAQMRVSRQLL